MDEHQIWAKAMLKELFVCKCLLVSKEWVGKSGFVFFLVG